jgi:hypothetical protein
MPVIPVKWIMAVTDPDAGGMTLTGAWLELNIVTACA